MYKMMGARPYKFTDEASGREVEGVSVFLSKPIEVGKGVGEIPVKKSLTMQGYQDVFGMDGAGPFVGKSMMVAFDENGKIVSMSLQK